VIVFQPAEPGKLPSGAYSVGTHGTKTLLGGGEPDPDDPATARRYFEQLFASLDTDREKIQELRRALDYPRVSERFRMIEEDTESVVITEYASPDRSPEGREKELRRVRGLLEGLRRNPAAARGILRKLQPYMVSVRSRQAEEYRRRGFITEVMEGVGEWHGKYHRTRGLLGEDAAAEALVL
jgi:CRISPR-associated endonuclease/helicase Cas3